MAGIPDPWNSARQEVEEACALLVDPSPANLDRCTGALGSAVARLAHSDLPALAAVRDLRAAVLRARSLLELAAEYHRRWQSMLQAMTGGYTHAGEAAPLSTRGRVSIQG